MALTTRSAAAKQAKEKDKATHRSITNKKIPKTPKRTTARITGSAAAKKARERKQNTRSSTTDKKILVTSKRNVAPITRSEAAKPAAQQKEDNEPTRCRSTTDNEKALETSIVRNAYRRYGPGSRVGKPVVHKTKAKTRKEKKNKKQFRCIFCNKKAFFPAEPHPSRAVGLLGCQNCGAAFTFRVTANLTCARDVQATLLAGGDIRWLSALQGDIWLGEWRISVARKSLKMYLYRLLRSFNWIARGINIYIQASSTFSFFPVYQVGTWRMLSERKTRPLSPPFIFLSQQTDFFYSFWDYSLDGAQFIRHKLEARWLDNLSSELAGFIPEPKEPSTGPLEVETIRLLFAHTTSALYCTKPCHIWVFAYAIPTIISSVHYNHERQLLAGLGILNPNILPD